eukprot:1771526-Rhodomonas_salina.3
MSRVYRSESVSLPLGHSRFALCTSKTSGEAMAAVEANANYSCLSNHPSCPTITRTIDALAVYCLVEHDGGALPGDAVLPVVIGGVHRGAAEHARDGAGGIGAVVGDTTPGRGGTNVTGVVMSQEGLDAHKLQKQSFVRVVRNSVHLMKAKSIKTKVENRMQAESTRYPPPPQP